MSLVLKPSGEWLLKLQSLFGEFRIAIHRNNTVGGWCHGTTKDLGPTELKEVNHRGILRNEVVWDYDETILSANEIAAKNTHQLLANDGLVSTVWKTGSKGYHVHLFLNPDDMREYASAKKRIIWEYYRTPGYKLDHASLGNTMIRLEHGYNEKTGKSKTLDLGSNDITINSVPGWVLLKANETSASTPYNALPGTIKGKEPNCLQAFFSESFYNKGDGTQRGLFIVTATLVETHEFNNALERLREWNSGLKKRFTDEAIVRKAIYCNGRKDRHMTCRYRHEFLQELGVHHDCTVVTLINTDSGKALSKEVPSCPEVKQVEV